ncbi:receptor-type tyrosine-protein phosphatase F-like [Branchiostoma floridae x Branchiostoma belcheri]
MTPLFQVLGFQIVFILSVLADSRNYVCPDPETCTSWSCISNVPATPPEQLAVWPVSSTELTATWNITQCGFRPFTDYICSVQYFSQWDDIARTTDVRVERPHYGSASLGDLTPFTFYRLRVRCMKILDRTWSGYTPFARARTNATAPGSAVNVHTPVTVSRNYRTGRRNVTVTWERLPPIKHNGILLGYLVRVTDLRVPSRVVVLNTTVNDTTCTLEQLKLSGYRVNITAYNAEGESPETAVEIRDEAKVPDEPLDLKAEVNANGNITLAWQPPAEIGGIEHYTVFWCELETDTTCRGGNESGLSVPGTYTTTNLIDSWLPFRRYRFTVRALTSAGQGPPSDNTYKYTVEGVPSSPPTNVNAQAENATTLMVSWLPVPLATRRGLITAYTVYITCMQNFQDITSITVNVENDSRPARSLMTDLKPFTWYSVRVSARTVAGEGNMSEPVFGTTKQSAPSGPPENVTIANITTNSFAISWSPPKHPNGIILHYNIRLKNKVMGFGNQTEGSLWGLKDGTNYSVQVQACTGAEDSPCGPFSPVKFVQTLKSHNVEPNPMDQSHRAVIAGATLGSVFVLVLMFIAVVSAPKLRQTCIRISYIPKPKDFITEELPVTNGKSTPSLDQLYLVTDKAKMAPEIVDNVMDLKTFELEPHDSQSEVDTSDVDIKENCGMVDSDEEDYLKVVEVKDRFQDLDVIYVPKTGITKSD